MEGGYETACGGKIGPELKALHASFDKAGQAGNTPLNRKLCKSTAAEGVVVVQLIVTPQPKP